MAHGCEGWRFRRSCFAKIARKTVSNMREREIVDILFHRCPMRMALVTVPEFRYVMANEAEDSFCKSIGAAQFIGMRCSDVWNGRVSPKFLDSLREVLATGEPREVVDEPFETMTDGQPDIAYMSFGYYPVRDESGAIESIFWVGEDTTREVTGARKRQAEIDVLREEARQLAAEWDALIRASAHPIYLTDDEGRLVEANPATFVLLDWENMSVEEASATPMPSMTNPDGSRIPPEDRPTARALRGESVLNFQYKLATIKGRERFLLQNSVAIDTPRGKRVLSIVTDITELKRLERLKDEFMLVVGHELKNPLQVIVSRLCLLRIKLGDEIQKFGPDLESLLAQTRLLSTLVEDLLTAYRVGNGRLTISPTTVDFGEIVDGILRTAKGWTQHEWSSLLPKGKVNVIADPQRLTQAIMNLVDNARKYTPPGKRIHMDLSHDDTEARLRIEDEGVGIPTEDLDKVFDGFYRSTQVVRQPHAGMGLGLNISRNLVKRMGGELWAENRRGGGTVMSLKMPLAK